MINLSQVNNTTASKLEALEEIKSLIEDPDKKERKASQLCVFCYYRSSIGGAAMTSRDCQDCGVPMMFSSTNTDCLCKACAKNLKVCRHCSADMNLKRRNKL
jgi:hypothetical protein